MIDTAGRNLFFAMLAYLLLFWAWGKLAGYAQEK